MLSYIRVRLSFLVGVMGIATSFLVFLVFPSARAVHAASRVQVAQPAASTPDKRLTVLLFDLTAMSADDVSRAANASLRFVDENLEDGSLVSVVTVSPTLRVLSDFTSDRAILRSVLMSDDLKGGQQNTATLTPQVTGSTTPRIDALRNLCQAVGPLQQKKSIMYFSGGSASARDGDDQAALNAATNSCRRANVLLYPVDARGLAAAAAGTPAAPGGILRFQGSQGR